MAGNAMSVTLTSRMMCVFCAVMVFGTGISGQSGRLWAQPVFDQTAKHYAIPAQDLDTALDHYTRITGTQVLYESVIAAGRQSTDVNGAYTPEDALATMLTGTGLVALRTDVNAFVIARTSRGGLDAAAIPQPDVSFLAALQRGVLDALCRNPRTRPGTYATAIELWIAPSGAIQRSVLIGSTGNLARDHMLAEVLRTATIAMKPPPNIPQPFVLTITRRSPRQTGDCSE